MMRLLTFCLTLTLLIGCKTETNDAVIKGSIRGFGNDTLYIYDDYGSGNEIDTIITVNDNFEIKIPTDTLSVLMMFFKDGTEYPLFIDKKATIEVTGNANSLDSLVITGNEYANLYDSFIKTLPQNSEAIQKKVADFISKHKSSIVSVYLLERFLARQSSPDYRQLKEVISTLSGPMQDQPVILLLEEKLNSIEKTFNSKSLPYFSLPDSSGTKISRTSEYGDKYLVLTFWSSWCDSSAVNNAELRKLRKKYASNKDFGMLGISLDTDKEQWKSAIKRDTLNWNQLSDVRGFNSEAINVFGIQSLPVNMLISPAGVILLKGVSVDSISNRLPEYLNDNKKTSKGDVLKRKSNK